MTTAPLYPAEKYTYRVLWSEDRRRYVGVCSEFPALSYEATTHTGALDGIITRVRDELAVISQRSLAFVQPRWRLVLGRRRARGRLGGRAMKSRRRAATRARPRSADPMREVVYIFEGEGVRGGALWWLVLACGHRVARKRHEAKNLSAIIHVLFEPIEKKLAPHHAQCCYCGSGCEERDPWATIRAMGGPLP